MMVSMWSGGTVLVEQFQSTPSNVQQMLSLLLTTESKKLIIKLNKIDLYQLIRLFSHIYAGPAGKYRKM